MDIDRRIAMRFTVWAYWQLFRLEQVARSIGEYLRYISYEIRNPEKDFIPDWNLPSPSMALKADTTTTYANRRKGKRKR